MNNRHAGTITQKIEPSVNWDSAASSVFVPPFTTTSAMKTAPTSPWSFLGLGLVMLFSPLTSAADPWVFEERRRWQSRPTTSVLIELGSRRRISLREARRMALQMMLDMEEARAQAAEDEAQRFIALESFA